MFLTISKTKADAYDDDNLISLDQGKIIQGVPRNMTVDK